MWSLGHVASAVIALPYYRFYRENTLIPIREIVDSLETGQRDELISQKMAHWRERKLLECQVVVVVTNHGPGDKEQWWERDEELNQQSRRQVKIRWNMIFTWQAPVMLMAYAIVCFLAGLTIYICAPLYDGLGFRAESKTAIFYLAVLLASGLVFIWCSFWVYHFIDLEDHRQRDEIFGTAINVGHLDQLKRKNIES